MKTDPPEKTKSMENAYRIAQELLSDRLKDVNAQALDELGEIKQADVIVVRGQYDHIEQVLRLSRTPFTLIDPPQLNNADLRPDQIVFINCPGNLEDAGLRRLNSFVSAGGFLFTTDWALKHVLEPAFPGFVAYNQKATADEVVRVEILDTDDPFLKSILGNEDDPQWWLESSSYPIRIIKEDKVHVLVKSKEIEEKYGESPVFITFDFGEGKVYHMISHFYLQRTETRTKRHASSAECYLSEKAIPVSLREKYRVMGIDQEELASVESAFTSSAMMSKILLEKRRQVAQRKKDGK